VIATFSNDTLLIGTRLIIGTGVVVFFCVTWFYKRGLFECLLRRIPVSTAFRLLAPILGALEIVPDPRCSFAGAQPVKNRSVLAISLGSVLRLSVSLLHTAGRFPNFFIQPVSF
jgi:hypothetical protein